jgi:hypothetical protein
MGKSASAVTEDEELRAALDPVWFNTYWVKNALELYEGVSLHAEKLNAEYGLFFGLVQKFSMDSAVLGICRLFDRSNQQYEKNTVPQLMDYLKTHFTETYIARLTPKLLIELGIPDADSKKMVMDLKDHAVFDKTKAVILAKLDELMPTSKENKALEQLFSHRNKILAHQEKLGETLKEQLRYLPSLDDMEKLNRWAGDFCLFVIHALSNTSLVPNGTSARMAALNVAAKILGKNFDPSKGGAELKEYEAFYRRL